MFSKAIIFAIIIPVLCVSGAPSNSKGSTKEKRNQPTNDDRLHEVSQHAKPAQAAEIAGVQAKTAGTGKETPEIPKTQQAASPHETEHAHRQRTVEPWRLCYFTNWAQYRPEPGTFWPENVDGNLCTHVYYAFGWMDGNNLTTYEVNDIDLYHRVTNLKNTYTHLKVVLAVGGWTFGTSKMTLMLSSKANRTEFINNVIQYLHRFNFDGLDLDFEWPGNRGSPPEDKFLYTCLLKEMRAAFDAENPFNPFIFTAGVGAGHDKAEEGYEMHEIWKYLDKINLMTYDFFGGPDPTVNPHSMLYNRANMSEGLAKQYNVDTAVQQWVTAGVPRHQINIGIALYGRGNTLQSPFNPWLGAPAAGPSNAMPFTLQQGIACHYEFCSIIVPQSTVVWSDDHKVPFCYNGDQWYGYENELSLIIKMQYIKDQGLGGFMLWTLDYDDFNGQFCGDGPYPLLTVMNEQLEGYMVPIDEGTFPPADTSFCYEEANGYYKDPVSCRRFYQCVGGITEPLYCPSPTIYDPEFEGCRHPNDMDQLWVCTHCPEHGDCSENKWYCDI